MCHNMLTFMGSGVTSSSRYSRAVQEVCLLWFVGVMEGVIGFSGCVSDGLQVEEFYDFVGSDRRVVWAHACNTLQVAVK